MRCSKFNTGLQGSRLALVHSGPALSNIPFSLIHSLELLPLPLLTSWCPKLGSLQRLPPVMGSLRRASSGLSIAAGEVSRGQRKKEQQKLESRTEAVREEAVSGRTVHPGQKCLLQQWGSLELGAVRCVMHPQNSARVQQTVPLRPLLLQQGSKAPCQGLPGQS